MRITVGQADRHGPGPHRCMINHDSIPQGQWDAGESMTTAGWTHQLEFYAFKEARPGTIRIAVGQADRHGPGPHCCMINHDSIPQEQWDAGESMTTAGWTHQLEFYAFKEARPGTIRIAVGQADRHGPGPHRCMINHDSIPQEQWDAGESMTTAGWTHLLEFWTYPQMPVEEAPTPLIVGVAVASQFDVEEAIPPQLDVHQEGETQTLLMTTGIAVDTPPELKPQPDMNEGVVDRVSAPVGKSEATPDESKNFVPFHIQTANAEAKTATADECNEHTEDEPRHQPKCKPQGGHAQPRVNEAYACACFLAVGLAAVLLLRSIIGPVDGLDGPWPPTQPPRASDVNWSCASVKLGKLCPIGCRRLDNTTCVPCSTEYHACSEFGGCNPELGNTTGARPRNETAVEHTPIICTCLVGFVGARCSIKTDVFSLPGAMAVMLIGLLTVCTINARKLHSACQTKLLDDDGTCQTVLEKMKAVLLPETLRAWLMYQPDRNVVSSWMDSTAGGDELAPGLFKCVQNSDSNIPRQHGVVFNSELILKLLKILQLGAAAFSNAIPWFEQSLLPKILSIPALDVDSLLPEWLDVELGFAWQVGFLVVLSRLMFVPDWMLRGQYLRKYRTGKFPKTLSDFQVFVPDYLNDLKRQVPQGEIKEQWVSRLFAEVDQNNSGDVDKKEWDTLVVRLFSLSQPKYARSVEHPDYAHDDTLPSKLNFHDEVREFLYTNHRDPNVSTRWIDFVSPAYYSNRQNILARSPTMPTLGEERWIVSQAKKLAKFCKKSKHCYPCGFKSSGKGQQGDDPEGNSTQRKGSESTLSQEVEQFVGDEALKRTKPLLAPQQLEKLQLDIAGILLIPMTRAVSGIYLGCTYYGDDMANKFDQDPSLSCWRSPRWWLYAVTGLYGMFVLITVSKASVYKVGDLSFLKRPDYPATVQYGSIFAFVQIFTAVMSVAIGRWHPITCSVAIVFAHTFMLIYLLIKQPYIHHFLNRLDIYGSIYNIVAYSCAIHATYVDDLDDEYPLTVYRISALAGLGIVLLIEVPLNSVYRKHHEKYRTTKGGRALSFPVANGRLFKMLEFETDKARAETAEEAAEAVDAANAALRNMIADDDSLETTVQTLIDLHNGIEAVLAKKEQGEDLMTAAKQEMTSVSFEKAIAAFDDATEMAYKDKVQDLDGLRSEAAAYK
eukprot:COSAG02_NODE_1398_length_12861_cov_74.341718_1_plen_1174_part_10